MGELAKEVVPVSIETEMKNSYLDYAMSVIVGRALPDVRDGLKPVHRRVLFAMKVLNNDWNKAYKKSARVVGDVIGKYHPHGDTAVYDTIVRMAQPFSMRYTLVDGQGNFGSVDGDNAAAMRYTEIRMKKIAHAMLADLEKETVNFVPNYDGTEHIPEVMPTRVPTLLVNGSSGIAVGMATNIPPHCLTDVVSGCLALIDDPEITIDQLIEYIPGPDFPTGGIINGREGIISAYKTGRGRIYVRAKYHIEVEKNGKESLVIDEIPYQVNKARLIEKINELRLDKKIEGMSCEPRDESDKDGMRIVLELKRGESAEVMMNNLFSMTQLENVFGINAVALVDGQPRTLNLKEILEAFVRHRREVVTRRTLFELRKARERGHLLEGLTVALTNIDPVIALIKASSNAAEAKTRLLATEWAPGAVMDMIARAGAEACKPDDLPEEYGLKEGKYFLSPEQAQAILDLRLHRLTGLEQEKLLEEYREILEKVAEYITILANPDRLMSIIREELVEIKDEYGDERRTAIETSKRDLTVADLIPEETMVVTISHSGYAKTQKLEEYQAQRRGGRGKSAASMKDEDFIEHLLVASSHDTILCFSSKGKVYWLRVFEIPQASRISKGRPIINILPLDPDEKISKILPVKEFDPAHFIFMATANGTVKKTGLDNFARPRSSGLIALDLDEGDKMIGAAITDGTSDVMLFSSSGKVIRFKESDVRAMGRTARGVRGIKLAEGQQVMSLIIPEEGTQILTTSANGYGKRTEIEQFPVYGRGGQGVIGMQTSDRNGQIIGAVQVAENDEIMLISDQGTLVRTGCSQVSSLGRNTQGVRLIKLGGAERLVSVERIEVLEGEELDNEEFDELAIDISVEAVVNDDPGSSDDTTSPTHMDNAPDDDTEV